MHRIITIIYGVLALSYIATTFVNTYSWSFLHKATPILLLCIIIWQRTSLPSKLLLCGALILSATGDMLLALPIEKSFLLGLSAFAAAHILYALFLYRWLNWQQINVLSVVIFTAYLITMMFVLLPAVVELRVPVLAYFCVISVMFVTAFAANTQDYTLRIGALFFVASDSLLAINAFITPLPLQSVLVMGTYYAAQYFIALGCLQLTKEHHVS